MSVPKLQAGRSQIKTVDTDVHSVFGPNDWDDAEDAGYCAQRTVNVFVVSGGDVAFKVVTRTSDLASLVSFSDAELVVPAGVNASFTLPSGQMLVCVSDSSSVVNARETVHVV